MKTCRTCLVAALMLLAPLFCHSQNPGTLVFQEKEFDFGTIKESDGPVTHSFSFVNMGGEPVYLASVVPSCSCTAFSLEQKSVPAGGSASIEVTYNPSMLPGPFRQNVLVRTAGNESYRLYVQGNVIPMETEDRFPYELCKGLNADSDELKFGFLVQGTSMEKTFRILNTGTESMTLSCRTAADDPSVEVTMPSVLKPGERAEVLVRVTAPAGRIGSLRNSLILAGDGMAHIGQVKISGSLVHVLSRTQAGPSLRFEPTRMPVRKGSGQVTLYNDGVSDLHILKIELPAGAASGIAAGTAIKPGESLKLKVSGVEGSSSIRLFTDDPRRPMREILTINSR